MGLLMNTIDDYKYLWDGSSPAWSLVQVNPDNAGEVPRYSIFNVETKRALLIRDDEIYAEVKKRMMERGVSIISLGGAAKAAN